MGWLDRPMVVVVMEKLNKNLNIMNLYDYIFYKAYKFQEFVGNVTPKYPTIIFLSGLTLFNFTSIYSFLLPYFDFLKLNINGIIVIVILKLALIIFLNIYYFNSKYDKIMNYYNDKAYKDSSKGHSLIITIILITLMLVYVSAYFSYYKANS